MPPTPPRSREIFDDLPSNVPFSFMVKRFLTQLSRYLAIIIIVILMFFLSKGIILVNEGETAVLIKKTGKDLTNFDIEKGEYRYLLSCPTIAPSEEYKGIQEKTLAEGWHVYNPYTWDYEIIPQVKITGNEVGVMVRLFGKPMDTKNYQVLAEDGEMGIMRRVLMPGQHLINKYAYKVIKCPAVFVPQGHRGVVTNLAAPVSSHIEFYLGDIKNGIDLIIKLASGKEVIHKYLFDLMDKEFQTKAKSYKSGDILGVSEKKLLLEQLNKLVLGKKSIYNAEAFQNAKLFPDTILFLKEKNLTQEQLVQLNRWLIADVFPHELDRSSFLVNENERGVWQDTLAPGTYYFNPFEKSVMPVDIRSHIFEMNDLQGEDYNVTFPSLDGFTISMEGNIEWCIDQDRAAEVLVKYKDHRDIVKCVEEKIILPNARAFIRIEGSKYKASDFISGLTREKFQESFHANLLLSCKHEGIIIKAARVTKCTPPDAICDPIQQREIAIRDRQKYDQEMDREREQIKLQMEGARKDFEVRSTRAQTTVEVNKTNASREREVAIIGMTRKVEVAKKRLEAAQNEAQAIILTAKAEADVVRMQNKAEASGIAEARQAFQSGRNYANFLMMKKVSGALEYILANTDSPFINVFQNLENKTGVSNIKVKSNDTEPILPNSSAEEK